MTSPVIPPRTIGVLGAGRVGTAVARQSLWAGYEVSIATAKPAAELAMIADIITPGARAVEAAEAAAADLVVLAVPMHRFHTLDAEALAGRTVVDTMNYWAPVDGRIAALEADPRSTSEVVQDFLAASRVVKTLNHLGYRDLEALARPADHPDRRALALAGDDATARAAVGVFLDRLGYDPVDAGPLAAGRAFEPDTTIFATSHPADRMRALLRETCAVAVT
ncbi:NADP oxidoreductase [Citricoccus sp. SGAir0253]|uniref:NADPH-dependent F420 reductase n=1 Tax=Citricoccus sp. SGAir0253 TaxID=2567881 RepID=UPI0010CCD4D7|nr:NAD(P)-binding domain-containing protein [Citricoccus sp. SGAir0253]QCU77005.1 NADP oxidoreductase [Citricoccus sp. SGAir0253]